jgi:hypothetical protein
VAGYLQYPHHDTAPRLGSVLKRMEAQHFVSKNLRLEKDRKTISRGQDGNKGNMIQPRDDLRRINPEAPHLFVTLRQVDLNYIRRQRGLAVLRQF